MAMGVAVAFPGGGGRRLGEDIRAEGVDRLPGLVRGLLQVLEGHRVRVRLAVLLVALTGEVGVAEPLLLWTAHVGADRSGLARLVVAPPRDRDPELGEGH